MTAPPTTSCATRRTAMILKSIVVIWSMFCLVILAKAAHDMPDKTTYAIGITIAMWGAVVVPVALVGMVFKRRADGDRPQHRVRNALILIAVGVAAFAVLSYALHDVSVY